MPILVEDINGDGLAEIIVGRAHSYGLDWWQQSTTAGKRSWTRHHIDPGNSQLTVTTVQSIDATSSTPTFYQHTGLNTERCRCGVAAWNGKIFVFGGDQGIPTASPFGTMTDYMPLATAEIYTP